MRGDLALQARLLLRPQGVSGLVGAVAGSTAFAAAYLPWYAIHVEVAALGATRSRPVAALAGWEAHPWVWVIPAVAVLTVAVGLAVAVDRPPPGFRELQLAAAVVLASVTGASALLVPPTSRFMTASDFARLSELAGRGMPDDVELVFAVHTAPGIWVSLAAAALLLAVGFGWTESRRVLPRRHRR